MYVDMNTAITFVKDQYPKTKLHSTMLANTVRYNSECPRVQNVKKTGIETHDEAWCGLSGGLFPKPTT